MEAQRSEVTYLCEFGFTQTRQGFEHRAPHMGNEGVMAKNRQGKGDGHYRALSGQLLSPVRNPGKWWKAHTSQLCHLRVR